MRDCRPLPFGKHRFLIHADRFADPARIETAYANAVRRAERAWQAFETACAELGARTPAVATAYGQYGWKTFEIERRDGGSQTLCTLPAPSPTPPESVVNEDLGARIEASLYNGMLRNHTMLALREVFDESVRNHVGDAARFGLTYRVECHGRVYWYVGSGDRKYPQLVAMTGDGEQRKVTL